MAFIVYGEQTAYKNGRMLDMKSLKDIFARARKFNRELLQAGRKVAYFFIDPLMHGFEAGNRFYCQVLGCEEISRLNYYRSGAGPLHALNEAKDHIDNKRFDAVFIFGYEPLLSNKKTFGKDAVNQAMDIFNGTGLLACYNRLAQHLCNETGKDAQYFANLSDNLFANYSRTFARLNPQDKIPGRGAFMEKHGAPLFRLTDCANPNLDFAGGILLAGQSAIDALGLSLSKQVEVLSVQQATVHADPDAPEKIVGNKGGLFPHIQKIVNSLQQETGLALKDIARNQGLVLDIYTCYPPIPLGFLIASGMISSIDKAPEFLEENEITLEGGLNLAGAPWNNPVLRSLVTMYNKLADKPGYGLVHGNGGIGENQAIALLKTA